MTAKDVLDRLRAAGCRLAAQGGKLTVRGRIPDELLPLVKALQTGIRAALTGRPWYGLRPPLGDRPGSSFPLNPAEPIPAGVTSACVEGDGSAGAPWNRLPPAAELARLMAAAMDMAVVTAGVT